jgi:hypothetical protein
MRSLRRRVAALETASRATEPDDTVWSLALDTGEGDFVFVGDDGRLKVCRGFDPRKV